MIRTKDLAEKLQEFNKTRQLPLSFDKLIELAAKKTATNLRIIFYKQLDIWGCYKREDQTLKIEYQKIGKVNTHILYEGPVFKDTSVRNRNKKVFTFMPVNFREPKYTEMYREHLRTDFEIMLAGSKKSFAESMLVEMDEDTYEKEWVILEKDEIN